MTVSGIPHLLSRQSAGKVLAVSIALAFEVGAIPPRVSVHSGTVQTNVLSSPLVPGHPADRAIAAGQRLISTLQLRTGQYVRLVLYQPGNQLDISLEDPGGNRLVQYRNRLRQQVSLSALARLTGTYTVTVSSRDGAGYYRLSVAELRDERLSDEEDIRAERAFEEAERLSSEYTSESSRASIPKYQEAALHWGYGGDGIGQTAAFVALGEVFTRLSERRAADQNFNRALWSSQSAGDKPGIARALNHLAYNYIELNQIDRSTRLSTEALRISREACNREQEGWALFNSAYASEMKGDKQTGLEFYQQALDVFTSIEDRPGQAHTLSFMGLVRMDTGDLPGARECLQKRALPLWEACGDRWGKALAENTLALVYDGMGEREAALGLDRESAAAFHLMCD
ncbi:MAG: tetratricopeptide repeat protein, partial [Blastocatellia bacterium]